MGRKTVESLFDLFMEEKKQPALPPMELITETATYRDGRRKRRPRRRQRNDTTGRRGLTPEDVPGEG
jgi:hypothetical protein